MLLRNLPALFIKETNMKYTDMTIENFQYKEFLILSMNVYNFTTM